MTQIKKSSNLLPGFLSDFFTNDIIYPRPGFAKEFGKWAPAVNITEGEDNFKVMLAAPDFKKVDFEIETVGNVLTISAEKETEKTSSDEQYNRREYYTESFSRSFTLPENVESDKIECDYTNGVLNINIPKKAETKKSNRKQISVK